MPNAHFYLHHHPRQEALADAMLEKLAVEGSQNPFHQSTVLVRNQGMGTWIKQRMANNYGIAMQINFPQPNSFLDSIISSSPIPPEEMIWKIFPELERLRRNNAYPILSSYLNADSQNTRRDLRLYQLSSKIAQLFDKYLLYRPDWISAWQHDQLATGSLHEPWQKDLWKSVSTHFSTHWSQTILASDSLEEILAAKDSLPSALHLFGISNFAPIYVRFLYLLSYQIPVHLYWLNPVDGYWGDGPSKKQWLLEKAFEDPAHSQLHHPLLSCFGKMGREFVHTIYGGNKEEHHVQEEDIHPSSFPNEQPKTILQSIQTSIRENKPNDYALPADDSVSIHSCHSPVRELECLRNYLLGLAEEKALDTGDVLVLCPNISEYAAAIDATMQSSYSSSTPHLPYRICDQDSPMEQPIVTTTLKLLNLNTSRFTNKEAIEFLNNPSIQQKLGISPEDLSTVENWIENTGIHWGLDQKHVNSILESELEVSWHWQAGLERLLLGLMLHTPESGDKVWKDILPFSDIEQSHASLLNALTTFVSAIKSIKEQLNQKQSLAEWVKTTRSWISDIFHDDNDTQAELKPMLTCLENLAQQDDKVIISSDVFKEHLESSLKSSSRPYGFLSGVITFCEMKPMRAIPTRVICLLGMNHDTFPRYGPELQFDLTKSERREADRSSRDDDVYFFLETLCCARESLFISYVGKSLKDNTKIPASTVVQTLIEHTPSLHDQTQEEKLHGFDPHYFQLLSPRSYDTALLESARTLTQQMNKRVSNDFSTIESKTVASITTEELLQAFIKPQEFFLKHSLKGQKPFHESPLTADEPLNFGGLQRWQIKSTLLNSRELTPSQPLEWSQQGLIPYGILGQLSIEPLVRGFADILHQLPEIEYRDISICTHHFEITGSIPCLAGQKKLHPIHISASSGKAKDKLTARILQLLASIQNAEATEAQLIETANPSSKDANIINEFTLDADISFKTHFSNLLKLYKQATELPLPHFPETSAAYQKAVAKKLQDPEEITQARHKNANAAWLGNDNQPGESCDFVSKLFFRDFKDGSPVTREFIEIAEIIWTPIYELLTKISTK